MSTKTARAARVSAAWFPIVEAFRTFVACPTPAIQAAFQQIQQLAIG